MPDLAFILIEEPVRPNPEAVIEAARHVGLELTSPETGSDKPTAFAINGRPVVYVMLMPAPHPDVPNVAIGPMSPPREELAAAPAHYIVTSLGLPGSTTERDQLMAILVGAILSGCKPVGVKMGHGVLFHRPDIFQRIAFIAAKEDAFPVELCVDVTVARDSEDRISLLTYNLPRYDREDFYITAPMAGQGALDFVLMMARWMIMDPNKHLPTGDTMGRSAEEKLLIQRTPNPIDEEQVVIRLDLPD